MNMQSKFDERTLSAYIDGEFDADTMFEVESILKQDENARRYILNAIKTSALLRSYANSALEEDIPEHLLDLISPPQLQKTHRSWSTHPLFRIAAAFLFIFIGLGAGLLIDKNGNDSMPAMILPLPDRYRQIVNETLEHNLSGASRQWREPQIPFMVTVTPIRTYRDQSGLYYREYRMEVTTDSDHNQIKGLAFRDANGIWNTKVLNF